MTLKPCPFCGHDSPYIFTLTVHCSGCDAKGPPVAHMWDDNKKEQLWNTRAYDTRSLQELEEYKQKLNDNLYKEKPNANED